MDIPKNITINLPVFKGKAKRPAAQVKTPKTTIVQPDSTVVHIVNVPAAVSVTTTPQVENREPISAPLDTPLDSLTREEAAELMHPEDIADRLLREERESKPKKSKATNGAAPKKSGLAAKLRSKSKAAQSVTAPPLTNPLDTSIVRRQVAGYTPTDEQENILVTAEELQQIRDKFRVLVIGAGAGAGKTSTLKMLEAILKGIGKYTAFNKSLVEESKTKFVKASCNTTHSLAFAAIGKLYAHRLNGPRVRSHEIARSLGIESMKIPSGLDSEGNQLYKTLQADFLAGQVMMAIKRFCQSADREIAASHFKYIDGIDMPEGGHRTYANNEKVREYLLPFAQTAWKDLSSTDGSLPFNHDCYVKVWQLGEGKNKPVIGADYILLDEYQDTAPVFLDILMQQTQSLLVLVGDDNQRIYEWRGAVNAGDYFPDAPKRLLSQSFRFGQSIADVANSVLATLDEPTDMVMKGLESIPSRVCSVESPRCMLFRTNAGAVSAVLQGVKDGKRPHLIGGGAETVAFVKGAQALQKGKTTSHPELCCFSSWKEVVEYSKSDEGEELRLMVKLIKEFTCEAILEALENMPDEKDADFVVSTAHKSKGREWTSVKLGGDFPLPNKMGDSDRRLLYVAATRAQHVLDITECPPFCGGYEGKDTGNPETAGEWVPGIDIKWTKDMPSKEELEQYLASKAEKASTSTDKPPQSTPSSAAGIYTWYKYREQWVVRGAPDMTGKAANVTRKDGSVQKTILGEPVQKYHDAWLYQVGK